MLFSFTCRQIMWHFVLFNYSFDFKICLFRILINWSYFSQEGDWGVGLGHGGDHECPIYRKITLYMNLLYAVERLGSMVKGFISSSGLLIFTVPTIFPPFKLQFRSSIFMHRQKVYGGPLFSPFHWLKVRPSIYNCLFFYGKIMQISKHVLVN